MEVYFQQRFRAKIKKKKTAKVIAACLILHNICCLENDIFIPPEEVDNSQINASVTTSQESPIACEFRNRLCESLN